MSEFEPIWRSAFDRMTSPSFNEPRLPIAKFGIKFLDDALRGIFSSDVILIGARTGAGKTEFVSAIAQAVAKQGKLVNLIALESELLEIEKRIRFKEFAKVFFEYHAYRTTAKKLSYMNWLMGDFRDLKLELPPQGYLKNLMTSYKRDAEFNIHNLHMHLLAAGNKMDLIILDHVHYIDLDEEKQNAELRKIIQMIRAIALDKEIPIIVVGHLRKSNSKYQQLVPDIEEFHGSSDLGKIATRAITIAPCFDSEVRQGTAYLFPTFIRIPKNRMDGSVTRYCALLDFDIRTNQYDSSFQLGKLNASGTEWNRLELGEEPDWSAK